MNDGRTEARGGAPQGDAAVPAVGGATQVIGIIGDPVTHSLSPRLHNAAFAALGLDYVYVPLPVRAADVEAAVRGLAALGLRGANITVPYKGAVLPLLDELSTDARLAQAVNTIVIDDGRLSGYNTDIEGARAALVAVAGEDLAIAPALILGAGGAARAIALALARLGCRLTIVNRTAAAAERLTALIAAAVPDAACVWRPLSELTEDDVRRQLIVVNATSLGMPGNGKVPALLADNVGAGQIVFDAVYGLAPTAFLVAARACGAETVDGAAMLVGQAVEAFKLWTGEPAPHEVMREVVQRVAGRTKQES